MFGEIDFPSHLRTAAGSLFYMKRFTETSKWENPWFRKLPPLEKLVLYFLWDACDMAGFWEIDIETIVFKAKLPDDKIRGLFEGLNKSHKGLSETLIIRGDFLWLKEFLHEQNNLPLNPLNNAHRKIISCINARPEFEEARLLLGDMEGDEKARISRKEAVWVRDEGICQYCQVPIPNIDNYELDHIVPRAAHVSEVYTNFATSCRACNQRKKDMPVDLQVGDYSAPEAKRDLRDNPTLLLKFNEFFNRRLRISSNSLTELGANISPIGTGTGTGTGKGTGLEGEGVQRKRKLDKQEFVTTDDVIAIRIATLFRRRNPEQWQSTSLKALQARTITNEDMDMLEAYYAAERSKGEGKHGGVHRRDLDTFMNNISGEIDRAHAFQAQSAQKRIRPVC